MALTPTPVIAAPAPLGVRYGLFTAANGPVELPIPHGLGGGVQYEPVTCGTAHRYPVECPTGSTPQSKVFDSADAVVVGDPFVVYATYICGAAGHTGAELEDKVRRRLLNGEQTAVEQELGDILTAAAQTLPPAADPDRIASVVAELEQWLYGADGAAYGHIGMLHAPIRFMSYAMRYGQLVRDGKKLVTLMGTVWSFGGGYPDDGSIFITGGVTVFRNEDILVPPAAQVLDRTLNEYRLVAEREYALTYDCVAAKAHFIPEADAS